MKEVTAPKNHGPMEKMEWPKMRRMTLPLVEGKCPPAFDENGNCYYPEPNYDYVDPEIREEENFSVKDKEEFYNYPTTCKACGTYFIAYTGTERELIRNYCPGCGSKLTEDGAQDG